MITLCGLPPHGGSGLKYLVRRKEIWSFGLPPHGGSGLKSLTALWSRWTPLPSPSTRREWIEIEMTVLPDGTLVVSLHTEGVD